MNVINKKCKVLIFSEMIFFFTIMIYFLNNSYFNFMPIYSKNCFFEINIVRIDYLV